MDITIPLGDTTLNIRVHIILQTHNGFLFFKSKSGHFACVGGRVKIGESSLAAAQRELEEETGLTFDAEKFRFTEVIENFYEGENKELGHQKVKFHEIGFAYLVTEKIDMEKIDPKFMQEFTLVEVTKGEIMKQDIRPEIIKKLVLEVN